VNDQAGARSRWSNIFASAIVILIVFALVDLVKMLPMAGLGGLLLVVGFQNLQPYNIRTVWATGLLAAAPGAPLTTHRSRMAGAARDVVVPLQLTLAALAMVHMPLVLSVFEAMLDPPGLDLAPAKVARQVATVTFVPLALGMLGAKATRGARQRHTRLLSAAAKALFLAFMAAILLALAVLPDLRATLLIGWAGVGASRALAALSLMVGHTRGGPGDPRRAGVAIATLARNLGLALYVGESAEPTLGAIPRILTYAVLSLVLALPCSRWMKRRIAASGAQTGPGPW
jgi:BASS family bile acid:Na+ symporter